MAVSAAGVLLLASMNVGTPFALATGYTVIVGVGFGLGMQVLTLAVQLEAPAGDLGAASSVVTSARQIGGSLGLAVLGGIFSATFTTQLHLHNIGAGVRTSPVGVRQLDPATQAVVQASYANALQPVFLTAGLLLVLAAIMLLPIIKRRQPTPPGGHVVRPPRGQVPARPIRPGVARPDRDLRLRVRNILLMLLAEFLLGIAVNLIGHATPASRGTTRVGALILVGLHEAVGVGLLIASIVILSLTFRSDATTIRYARYGAAGAVGAFIAGLATVATPPHKLLSFLMAALGAFAATAYVLLYIHATQPNPTHAP